ncbi:MAG: hypothetical protein O3B87_02330 [bacterium]|nr:hypothetical protein [bacterium]
MITDADIQKLAQVFATKDDLKGMEANIRRDMATKDDLKRFATKDDLERFASKDDLEQMQETIINTMKEEVLGIYELLGEQSDSADKMLQEQRGHRVAIGDFEKRIQVLEHVHAV